jgi:YVTN family beta-propeller protein
VRIADGRILDEVSVGQRPVGLALHPNGNQLLVTGSYSGEVYWIDVADHRLKLSHRLKLGFQPHAIAVDGAGKFAYIALTDADQIAVVDLSTKTVDSLIDVGRWPRYLALSASGKRLAVGTSGDRGISIVDTEARKLLAVDRFVGLNIGQLVLSKKLDQVYFPWVVYRRNPITDRNIRLGWVLASRLGRIGFDEHSHREAISLDPPGKAIADPHGIALSSSEQFVVMSAAGSHELIVLQSDGLPFKDRGSTDHIDAELVADANRFFRVELGGRPMGLKISADDSRVYVANYLDNSVQLVDLGKREVIKKFNLGGSPQPSLARQGEAIFLDGRRSLDQWYSCYTCHYEGGSNSVTMDTMNDGSAFTFKTVLPLYELDQTPPWTWHGYRTDLVDALDHSLKTTMLGPAASQGDARALAAYLSTLKLPPNSNQPQLEASDSLRRGRDIFHGPKGGCVNCHLGSHFTDTLIHDLGLGTREDSKAEFSTPTLRGVFRKVLLLHDGRAESLKELLRNQHAPLQVAGESLTEGELDDLVEYVRSL